MQTLTLKPLFVALFIAISIWIFDQTRIWDALMRSYEARLEPAGWSLVDSPRQRVFLDNDPYYWLAYAGDMIEHGAWRIRATTLDNTPFGRQMHWSQSIAWLMVLFGAMRRFVTGQAWPGALEDGAIWINPTVHLLLALAGGWLIARRMGLAPAALWLLGVASLGDLLWAFHPLRPDHQSLHILFSSLSVILLSLGGLGWVVRTGGPGGAGWRVWRAIDPPGPIQARWYVMASGLCGGLGLWTGATVQMLTLGAAAVAGLYLVLNMPLRDPALDYRPEWWRWWALTGAGTSLVFYGIEYAAAWPGVRLEVNSPLHALGWLGMGELLTRLARARRAGLGARAIPRMIVPAFAVALLPLAVTLGPAHWHVTHNVEMRHLHNFILEFYTFSNFKPASTMGKVIVGYGVLPLLIPMAIWLGGPRRSSSFEWGLLWVGFALATAMGLLAWFQVRWLPFFAAAALWLLPLTAAILAKGGQRYSTGMLGAFLLVAVSVAQSAWFAGRAYAELRKIGRPSTLVVEELTKGILTKHLATAWGAVNTAGTFRVLCEPDLAGPLYYFGRIPSVTSFYWENQEGLSDAVAFLSDEGDEQAREVARRRGLTHVMLPQGEDLAGIFYFIRHGQFDGKAAAKTLAGRLANHRPPTWIRREYDLTEIGHRRYRFATGHINSSVTVYALKPSP